jgi:hypothetical protein
MARGDYKGKGVHDGEIRRMFTRESLLASEWYARRLANVAELDRKRWERCVTYLRGWMARETDASLAERLGIRERLAMAEREMKRASAGDYAAGLRGTIGGDRL